MAFRLLFIKRGTFAKPAQTFPNSLGKIQLFVEYPYLLPCSVSDSVALSALVACAFFFREVSPKMENLISLYMSTEVLDINISPSLLSHRHQPNAQFSSKWRATIQAMIYKESMFRTKVKVLGRLHDTLFSFRSC